MTSVAAVLDMLLPHWRPPRPPHLAKHCWALTSIVACILCCPYPYQYLKSVILHPQGSFQKAVTRLQGVAYSPLDVGAKEWSADFGAFLAAVRDLEASFGAAMQAAFDRAGSLLARMQLVRVRHCLHGKACLLPSGMYAQWHIQLLLLGTFSGCLARASQCIVDSVIHQMMLPKI